MKNAKRGPDRDRPGRLRSRPAAGEERLRFRKGDAVAPGEERLRFRKGDAVAAAGVVLAALALLGWMLLGPGETAGAAAKIYQDGRLIRQVSLSGEETFELTGPYRNVVTVREGKIAITESNCPGEDCVHSGWISRPGRSVVCLPNRVEIRVEGSANVDDSDDVDAVVR